VREEFTDPAITTDPADLDDIGLRPKSLDDFVGQRELKEHLGIV
jgi:Holliday junction resolvasome RuvABC ATP-dependent DNA helicase subunit